MRTEPEPAVNIFAEKAGQSSELSLKNEKGFALVITLLITALLLALTAEFASEVFVDTSSRHSFVAGQQASLLSESGITGGVKLLQLSLTAQNYTSLNDQWAKPLKISDERGDLLLSIEEESGKLNLNSVSPPNGEFESIYYAAVARRLFKKLNLGLDLIDALADWIDINDYPHPGGAETTYYSALKPPYSSKNGRLDTVEELALVKGFSGKPLESLRSFVTVYQDIPNSPASPININTASKEIIMALDDRISDSLADRVMEYRKSTPIKSAPELLKVPGFETIATGLITNICTKGAVFRLKSQGEVQGVARTTEAVVRVAGGGAPAYLYWREY
jgi:general secretion pathway protein K